MFVRLNGKRLEASLINRPRPLRMMVQVPAAYVRHGQPLRVDAQVAVVLRPDDEVPVVGQERVGEEAHARVFPGLPQYLLEGGVVCRFVKDRGTSHRTVEDVIDITCMRASHPAGHKAIVAGPRLRVKTNLT